MTTEMIPQVEELLNDAHDNLADKKQFTKAMKDTLKECGQTNNIEKKVLSHVKDYYHYKGANWQDGSPLKKNPNAEYKDKVSPVFIKLLNIFQDLEAVGDTAFLQPYVDALLPYGIKIEFDAKTPDTKIVLTILDRKLKLQVSIRQILMQLQNVLKKIIVRSQKKLVLYLRVHLTQFLLLMKKLLKRKKLKIRCSKLLQTL